MCRRKLTECSGAACGAGTTTLTFTDASVVTNNLGGWCGYYCLHVRNGPNGIDPGPNDGTSGYTCTTGSSGNCPGYDLATGTCADPATPYTPSGQYYFWPGLGITPECTVDDDMQMRLTGVGTTAQGNTLDLVITNESLYVPWNANQNGLNGDWAEVNVLGNEPVRLLFCFKDHVRRSLAPSSSLPPPKQHLRWLDG